MNRKARQNAIILQVSAVFLTFGILAGGISVRSVKAREHALQSKKSSELLELKFRPKIGTTYTEDMHNKTVGIFANLDSSSESLWDGFGSLSNAMIVFGSGLSILTLANLFLLIRAVPKEP